MLKRHLQKQSKLVF